MPSPRRTLILTALAASLTMPAVLASTAAPVGAQQAPAVVPGFQRVLLAGPGNGQTTFVPPPGGVTTQSSTINVSYDTDFNANPQAKAAFQFAVNIWQGLYTSSVPINITASLDPLGTNVLGQSGPNGFVRTSLGCSALAGDTYYAYAMASAICGTDTSGSTPDASAQFNKTFPDWYFGIDGHPPSNKWDFVTVVLHELGHALGFISSFDYSGGSGQGTWGFGSQGPCPCPMIYDRFIKNGAGQRLIDNFPNDSVELGAQLTGHNLFFDGANADAGNSPTGPAKIYAPSSWSGGSSISHLDESTFQPPNVNALMTPILSAGEAIQNPGPITLGAFQDMLTPPSAPAAPTGPTATAGSNAASVAFTPPTDDGESTITSFTVTASPGGATGTGRSSPVWVAGLTNGTAYTFTVSATNSIGQGPASGVSNSVTPRLQGFHPLDPRRILDTRVGNSTACPTCQGTAGALGPEFDVSVQVAGQDPNIPNDGSAYAAVINVTAVNPSAAGWLTIWDTGDLPNAANLNFGPGQTVPNLVTVKLANDGSVQLGNSIGNPSAGTVDVIFDVVGYYSVDPSGLTDTGVPIQPLNSPVRILDTRGGCGTCQNISGPLPPQSNTPVQIEGQGGGAIPGSGVDAVVMNVTVTGATAPGWLTIWPSGSPPNAASLNFTAGQTVSNLVTVEVANDGSVRLGNTIGSSAAGSVHVIFDVLGWYGASANGGGLNAFTPVRIADTRIGVTNANGRNTPLTPQEQATFTVGGFGGVPPSGVGVVVLNTTAVTPSAYGWLTIWPSGGIPNAANLTFAAGETVANLVVAAESGSDTVKVGNTVGNPGAGFVHVIFDVGGFFAPIVP